MGMWVSVQALFFSTTLAFDVQSPKQSLVQVVSLCTQRKSRSCKPAERTNVKRMIGNGGAASQSETPTEPIPRLIPYCPPLAPIPPRCTAGPTVHQLALPPDPAALFPPQPLRVLYCGGGVEGRAPRAAICGGGVGALPITRPPPSRPITAWGLDAAGASHPPIVGPPHPCAAFVAVARP